MLRLRTRVAFNPVDTILQATFAVTGEASTLVSLRCPYPRFCVLLGQHTWGL